MAMITINTFSDIPWPALLAVGSLVLVGIPRATRTIDKTISAVMTFLVLGFRLRRIRRDPQRMYTAAQKAQLHNRAGGRCEHKHPLWIRCMRPGAHADHVIPWSKGGRTIVDNGQWLCACHNLRKSDLYPSPVYVWRLESRRSRYKSRHMP